MDATLNAPSSGASASRNATAVGRARTLRSLALESRFELVRLARQPSYVLPLFAFPLAFYYFFGIAMNGAQRYPRRFSVATYLLASYGAFGVIGAALFGFGVSLALERGNGWLILKRASPMRLWSYLAAKIARGARSSRSPSRPQSK